MTHDPSRPLIALPRWLVPTPDQLTLAWFIGLVALIWVIGFVLRLRWLIDYGWDAAPIQWGGTPLLTSADGYYFAAGVQAAVAGDTNGRIRIPEAGDHALVALGWLVVKVLGVSVDQYAVYMPAVLSPLIAVPLACIGRTLRRSAFGLAAALAMVVAPGFFVRTSAGYFDSDTFAIMIPLVAVACFVRDFVRPSRRGGWAIAGAAVLAAYPFFYDQGGPLSTAMAACAAAYVVLFHRNDAWGMPLLAGLGLGQLDLHWSLCVALAIAAPLAFQLVPMPRQLARWLPVVLLLIGFILSPAWAQMVQKLGIYTGNPADLAPTEEASDGIAEPVFRDSTRFVAEAQKIDLTQVGQRAIGWLPLALLAGVGMALLVVGQRTMLLLAPMAALGLISVFGSLRFTIYLSPMTALGAAWLACVLASRIPDRVLGWTTTGVLAIAIAVPGFLVDNGVRPKPSVIQPEVAALVELSKRIQPGDTVVSWWDYGYAIGYFSKGRTVVDGGRRFQDANLAAEMLLGTSQRAAVNLASTATYWLEKRPDSPAAPMMFKVARERGLDPSEYLAEQARPDAVAQPPTGDIYFYLPARMLGILPAIDQLRPIERGQTRALLRGAAPMLLEADGERLVRTVKKPDGSIEKEMIVDGKKMTVKSKRGGERQLKRIHSIAGGGGKPVEPRVREGNPKAATVGIFLRRIGIFAEMEERLVDSFFVQLFAFEKPDPALLELVFANDAAKIYRFRR